MRSTLLCRDDRPREQRETSTIEEVTQRFAADKVFSLPPAGRLSPPEDLALVVCMLASPMSGFVTGANYCIDGGQVRSLN